jgi:iron(III) transport system ATP-binding protein
MTVTLPIRTARAALMIEALVIAHGATPVVHGLHLEARAGELVTLLGPSGCGKTTTLRAIAGLETPLRGRIAIAGNTVFDAAAGIDLPPERRGLSMVFQSYAIWPHMTVFDNVAFGLRARGAKRAAIADAVQRSLGQVGLAHLADRPATRLSGGQQQRVALARSIAGNPGVILLDEPLSNLDAQLRLAMRAEFKALQRDLGLTAIYVTHDQEEALVLSDRIAVMRDGRIEQSGTPAEIYDTPASRFVADFMGVRNLLPCQTLHDGGRVLAVLAGGARIAVRGAVPDGPACLGFRPSAVTLSRDPAPGAFAATVTAAIYLGDTMQYELASGSFTIHARAQRFDLAEGAPVYWSVPPDACFLVPA